MSSLNCWLRSYGLDIKALPFAECRQRVEESPDNVLYPLLPTLPKAGMENEQAIPEISSGKGLAFDCGNTFNSLGNTSLNCASINAELIQRYLAYFVDTGFLDAPARSQTNRG